MTIKDKYTVRPIDAFQCKEWLLKKHYAKREPSIEYSFGLFNIDMLLQGILTFGLGGNINNNSFGEFNMKELNRLVINDGLDKNVLSFFVMKSINLLPKPLALISYADEKQHHHGYIYQATNWIYTGLSSAERTIVKDGKEWHRKTLFDIYGTSSIDFLKEKGFEILGATVKHRYLYFNGNKRDVKKMKLILYQKYEILPYPKGNNERYDASYKPSIQTQLF